MVGNLKKLLKKKMLGNLRDKVTRKKRQISFGLTFVNKDKAMSIKK